MPRISSRFWHCRCAPMSINKSYDVKMCQVTYLNDGRCLLMLNAVNNTHIFATTLDFCYTAQIFATIHSFVLHYADCRQLQRWSMSMNTSCDIYKWVVSRICKTSYVSYMIESCHKWMSHIMYKTVMSYMNESCHVWNSHVIHEWVVSCMKQSCHTW